MGVHFRLLLLLGLSGDVIPVLLDVRHGFQRAGGWREWQFDRPLDLHHLLAVGRAHRQLHGHGVSPIARWRDAIDDVAHQQLDLGRHMHKLPNINEKAQQADPGLGAVAFQAYFRLGLFIFVLEDDLVAVVLFVVLGHSFAFLDWGFVNWAMAPASLARSTRLSMSAWRN